MTKRSLGVRVRASVVALAALLGGGAAYAAMRTTTPTLGTGVVVIDTNLAYQDGAAAGTGMVLTSSGRILTNNHVIAGATTIRVLIPHTAHRYSARVVGYDRTADVAVLQLQAASRLTTVRLGDAARLTVGARVTAVGNAGGTGTLTSTSGSVTGLRRSISVQGDDGSTERLSGLIETDAGLQPGDSGGPLLNSAGRVVGMDTAASTNGGYADTPSNDGYAIPIGSAMTIAGQIAAGRSSAAVHIGGTPLLGVQVSDEANGVTIVNVVQGGPASNAGLQAGDVVTGVDGTAVSSASGLTRIILAHRTGDRISLAYNDGYGSHSVTVTLGSGPPQ
jgi:S1-C subfamily serine protease